MLTKTEFSLKLDEDLEDLRGIKGRCFSDEEYQKRWQKVITYLEDTKLDSLIIYVLSERVQQSHGSQAGQYRQRPCL